MNLLLFLGVFYLTVFLVASVVILLGKIKQKLTQVELRDLNGNPLGLTKKQYKKYMLSLGTKDKKKIAKAYMEVRQRKAKLQGK